MSLNLKKTKSRKSKSSYSQNPGDLQDNDNDDYNEYDYEFDENDLKGQVSFEHIKFLEEKDISEERDKIISQAEEKLFLERPQAILVMIYYEWNLDKLDSWYDKDPEENKIKVGIELSEKLKNKFKKEGVESFGNSCLACYEEKDGEKDDNFYGLNCGHQFCSECWEEYLKEKLKSPLGALEVKCPQHECTCIVGEDVYKKFIKDKDLLEKLNKAIYKNFINRNEDLRQCPNPHCKYYIKSNIHSAREVKCKCGLIYCFNCTKESHRPCSCEMFEKWNKLNENSKNDDKWIEANTKECPHCHQKIERSQGCNYMFCNPTAGGCGKAFCYVCEVDWEKHSQDHFNCNKYTDEVKKKEKKAKKLQEQLKRYDFYFFRYMNNKQAVEIVNTKLRDTIEEKVNKLHIDKNISALETKFILDALDTVIKGKRLLQNTYIFGYYMKDENKKPLFEHEQGILQFLTEDLHRHLIDKSLSDIIEIKTFEDYLASFTKYKNTITILMGSIQKYTKNLIDSIENNFISEIDYDILDDK